MRTTERTQLEEVLHSPGGFRLAAVQLQHRRYAEGSSVAREEARPASVFSNRASMKPS